MRAAGASERGRQHRARVFMSGVMFVLGFSLVFIILGVSAGTLGGFLLSGRVWLARIGGALVVLFGLTMLDIISIPQFQSTHGFNLSKYYDRRGTYAFSFLLGVVFGSGWTPCIGPVLGSILVLAGTGATAGSGALLLGVFSLGLAIPFLLIALGIGRAQEYANRYASKLGAITKIAGLLLIALGLLLIFDKLYILAPIGYRLLDIIGYDRLLNYL